MMKTEQESDRANGTAQFEENPSAKETVDRIVDRMDKLTGVLEEQIKDRAELFYLERLRTGAEGNKETDWLKAESEICDELDACLDGQGANNHTVMN